MGAFFGSPRTTMAGVGMILGVLLKIYGKDIGIDANPETFNNLIYILAGGGFAVGGDGK